MANKAQSVNRGVKILNQETHQHRQLILLSRVVVVLNRVMERQSSNHQLSLAQYRFLLGLKRGAKRSSQLAISSGISRPTASALVDDMEAKGIIEKTDDPTDRRATMIKLTEDGLGIYSELEDTLATELANYFEDGWSPEILGAIEKLAYLIDEKSPASKKG